MPIITFRVSHDEKTDLEAQATDAGLSVSEYIRQALHICAPDGNAFKRLADLETRVDALESS